MRPFQTNLSSGYHLFFANRCQWSRGKRWSEKEIGTSDRLVQKRNKSTVHPSIHQSIISEKWTDTPRRFLPTKTHYAYVLSLGRYLPCMCIYTVLERRCIYEGIFICDLDFPVFPPYRHLGTEVRRLCAPPPRLVGVYIYYCMYKYIPNEINGIRGKLLFQEKYFLKKYNKRIIRKKRGKTKTEKKAEGGVCCGRVGVLSPAGHKKKAALR